MAATPSSDCTSNARVTHVSGQVTGAWLWDSRLSPQGLALSDTDPLVTRMSPGQARVSESLGLTRDPPAPEGVT